MHSHLHTKMGRLWFLVELYYLAYYYNYYYRYLLH